MKCNNCTKFLTCNRENCKQVTYLQAGQIDKVEEKKEKSLTELLIKFIEILKERKMIWKQNITIKIFIKKIN